MSHFNILVATDLTDDGLQILEQARDVTLTHVTPSLNALREGMAGAQAIIARDDVQIDGLLLDHAPALKIIGRVGAGLGGIDMETATSRGIIVTNTASLA